MPDQHLRDVTKMVAVGSGAQREIDDVEPGRLRMDLIAWNGDQREPASQNRASNSARSTALNRVEGKTAFSCFREQLWRSVSARCPERPGRGFPGPFWILGVQRYSQDTPA